MDLLISLLITVLLFVLVYYIVMAICGALKVSPDGVRVVKLIMLFIALVWLLRVIGVFGGGPFVYYHRP